MSDIRIRYGLAMGPYGTAGATSANHLIVPGDTTPDVSLGAFFVTANTTATVISYFDVVGAGGVASTADNGKIITLLFQDNLTTIANAGRIFYAGSNAAFTSGQTVSFVYYNSAWYQWPNSEVIGREDVKTFTLAAGSAAINVAGVRTAIVTPSGGAITILGFSGGVVGQYVTILKDAASAGTGLNLLGQANFQLASTALLVMDGSAAYSFVCDNGTRFRELAGPSVP